jgi:hypothetical protein
MLTELSPLAKFAFRNFKLRKFKWLQVWGCLWTPLVTFEAVCGHP